jgi:hypothetical protein
VSNQAGTHPPGELRKLAKLARVQGWTVTKTRRGGHWRWQPPDGGPVFTEGTRCYGRAAANSLARLRAAGLVLPRERR